MFNCLRPHVERTCAAREFQSSHAGGNDYSGPCVHNVNEKGRHKGLHRTAGNKYSWAPGPSDRWDDGTWRGSETWVDIRQVENPIFRSE